MKFLNPKCLSCFHRFYATLPNRMSAWQIDKYCSDLYLNNSVPLPKIQKPDEILIEVKAASLNPIDTMMKDGYGDSLIGLMRQFYNCSSKNGHFPMILGRDCSGIVRSVGQTVTKFKPGDDVYCAIGPNRQGTLAQYTVTEESSVSHKPKSLDFAQSASIPYVAATVWMALCTLARLNRNNCKDLNILIHGGTGGVGTLATQLLRAWGSNVICTCSSASQELAKSLGATPVDYNSEEAFEKLMDLGPFDVILDTVGSDLARESINLLGLWRHCVFVSLTTPLLRNSDSLGAPLGLLASAAEFARNALWPLSKGRWYAWCYFMPNGGALEEISDLIDKGEIKPIIERIVSMDKLPETFESVAEKHGKGKTVIRIGDFD